MLRLAGKPSHHGQPLSSNVRPQYSSIAMEGLAIATALLAFFAAVGAAVDNLVMPHQNSKLQDRLVVWWNYVDDVKFRDVAHTMVEFYLRLERRLFGAFPSWRWLLTALLASAVLTTFAVLLGRTLGLYLTFLCNGNLQYSGGPIEAFFTLMTPAWTYFRYNVDHFVLYALNITFDAVTLATTLFFLRVYVRRRGLLPRYILVAADIAACLLFLYTCMFVAFYADITSSGIKHTYWTFYEHLLEPLARPDCSYFHTFTSTVIFSSTVLLPTLTYLGAIFFFLNAKVSLEASRWVVAHILELGATQKKTVFFYTGVYIGLLAALGKLTQELIKAIG